MLNKNRKPLISLPPTEGLYFSKMMFKKSVDLSKRIPIIVVPEEAGSMIDEIQKVADDNKVEVAIIGMGKGNNGLLNLSMSIAAMSLTLAITEQQKKDKALVIDDTEKQRGLSFSFNDLVKDVEPTIPFTGRLVSSKEQFLEIKKPKKERAQNNRKKKKHKKAKNGR